MKRKNIKELFISYVNEFVSISGFADHYGFTIDKARQVLMIGHKLWIKECKGV